ncbi:hypothetical protein N9C70_05155 [Flavobacteriales bacterium]|nr:hypothetical protein [Flavobacteriales bacterium]
MLDSDEDGICDGDEIPGCTDDTAVNFHPAATENDGTCVYGFVSSCLGDIDNNGVVGVGDVLLLLNFYSSVCE